MTNKNFIRIVGDRENNLKNVSLDIPKHKITIFTGVSGSGKSSLVFDTLANESQRLLSETYSNFIRQFMPKYERPKVDSIENLPASIVIGQRTLGGNARSTLSTITDIAPVIRALFARAGKPHIGGVGHFSFNDPAGMCPNCQGLGRKVGLDMSRFIDESKSLKEGPVLFGPFKKVESYMLSGFFDNDLPIKDYPADKKALLYYGDPDGKTLKVKMGAFNLTYEGLVAKFNRNYLGRTGDIPARTQKLIDEVTHEAICETCGGKRLSAEALSVRIGDYSLTDLLEMQLSELPETLEKLPVADKSSVKLLAEQISHLVELGLGYLTLDRETATLSGGESQRVKLVKHLNNSLTDMLYIFDEPSIGLHPRDVARMNEIFIKLRDKGNTVLIIEHDPDVIKIADWVVEVGPHAGKHGGKIVFAGTYEDLLSSDSLTGKFLANTTTLNTKPRLAKTFYEGLPSSVHNLKNQSLKIPKNTLSVLTGVAGSGKSTLVENSFLAKYPDAVVVTQNALASNSRSNPATFIGIMDPIRKLFAKENGVAVSLFSYNSEGACEACHGNGYIESNLAFMETVRTTCEVCEGKRYKAEVLDYRYEDRNIVDVLDLSVEEAEEFFKKTPAIKKKIAAMREVGLGYITLGQQTSSLSGGEKQRLKLASEFYQKGEIYILDEPSTGLHLSDIARLVKIMNHFVDGGNTLIVIEHQLDIIKQADWIVDIGPDGGDAGGEIVYEGAPAGIVDCARSITGKYV